MFYVYYIHYTCTLIHSQTQILHMFYEDDYFQFDNFIHLKYLYFSVYDKLTVQLLNRNSFMKLMARKAVRLRE